MIFEETNIYALHMDIYVYVYVTESQKKTKIYETGCLKCAITRKEKKKCTTNKIERQRKMNFQSNYKITILLSLTFSQVH
jgi:hypothetical protein